MAETSARDRTGNNRVGYRKFRERKEERDGNKYFFKVSDKTNRGYLKYWPLLLNHESKNLDSRQEKL